ncbi:MAG: hypothetical protein ACOC10_00170 [Bacteroidota bacterium]
MSVLLLSSCEEYERVNPYDENSNCYTINKGSEATITNQDIVISYNFEKITEDNPVLYTGIRYLYSDILNYENYKIQSVFNENSYYHEDFYHLMGKPNTGEQQVILKHLPPGSEIYYQSFLKYDDDDSRIFYGEVGSIKKEPTNIPWHEITTYLPPEIPDDYEANLHKNITVINNEIFSIIEIQQWDPDISVHEHFAYLLKYDQNNEEWTRIHTIDQKNESYFGYVNCNSHIVCFYKDFDYYYYDEYNPKTNRWSARQFLPADLQNSFSGNENPWNYNVFVIDSTLYVFREGDYLSTYTPGFGWDGWSDSNLQESELREIIAGSHRVSLNSWLYLFKESDYNSDDYIVYKWQPNESLESLNDNPGFPQGIKNYIILNDNLYLACEYYIKKQINDYSSGKDLVTFIPEYDYYGNNRSEQERFWNPEFHSDESKIFTQRALFKLNLNTGSLSDDPLLIAPMVNNTTGDLNPAAYQSPNGSHYFSGLLEKGLYNWHSWYGWNQTRFLGSLNNAIIMYYPRLDVDVSSENTETKLDVLYQLELDSALN